MLASDLGAAGGTSAAITGAANNAAATSRNAGGFQAVLDDAARQRAKEGAGASERVAASSADLAQQKQQGAAKELQGLYGTDTSGMLDATGQQAGDINAEVNANNSGWLQQATGVLSALGGAASGAGGLTTAIKCWIAAEVYNGWLDPRVSLVRSWIFGDFAKSFTGSMVAWTYLRFGERLAEAIRQHPVLRRPFKAIFDCVLSKAVQSH